MSEPARCALVTGGASGLGRATCELFTARGWRAIVADRDEDGARRAAEALPGAVAVACDVSSTESVERAIAEVSERFGSLDVLVNNAGVADPAPSHTVDDERWERLIGIHLGGTFRLCRASIPLLARGAAPAIVNVSSVCASRGFPGRLSYNAAKAAIESLTRTLAAEWGPIGVRVNAVSPGFVWTEGSRQAYESGVADAGVRASMTSVGRLGEPHEVAEAVFWLASESASYVTGHVLAVDGGFLAQARTGPDPFVLDADALRADLGAA